MRHVIFARSIASSSRRMIDATSAAQLIAATGLALRLSAYFLRTSFGAIHLAAITMAADQHLDLAATAQK